MKIVYALIDPRNNSTFYIGMGEPSRPRDHFSLSKRDENVEKKQIIKEILDEGLEPIICVLHKDLTTEEARNLEIYHIGLHKRIIDGGTLTNRSKGGEYGGWGNSQSNPKHGQRLRNICNDRNKSNKHKDTIVKSYREKWGNERSPTLSLQWKYWYHTPFGCFKTVNTIDLIGFSIQCCTSDRCDNIVTAQSYGQSKMLKSIYSKEDCVGKTYRELGFYPVPLKLD